MCDKHDSFSLKSSTVFDKAYQSLLKYVNIFKLLIVTCQFTVLRMLNTTALWLLLGCCYLFIAEVYQL